MVLSYCGFSYGSINTWVFAIPYNAHGSTHFILPMLSYAMPVGSILWLHAHSSILFAILCNCSYGYSVVVLMVLSSGSMPTCIVLIHANLLLSSGFNTCYQYIVLSFWCTCNCYPFARMLTLCYPISFSPCYPMQGLLVLPIHYAHSAHCYGFIVDGMFFTHYGFIMWVVCIDMADVVSCWLPIWFHCYGFIVWLFCFLLHIYECICVGDEPDPSLVRCVCLLLNR